MEIVSVINYEGVKTKLHMIGRKYGKLGREEKLYTECWWRNLIDRHHKEHLGAHFRILYQDSKYIYV